MEKVLKKMPGTDGMPSASVVLEINLDHPVAEKLKALYTSDKDTLAKYAKILYSEACLVSGISLENPTELCELVSELMLK
jgi:molecular chaperone HtpG